MNSVVGNDMALDLLFLKTVLFMYFVATGTHVEEEAAFSLQTVPTAQHIACLLKVSSWLHSSLPCSPVQLNAGMDLLGRHKPLSSSGSLLHVVYVSN